MTYLNETALLSDIEFAERSVLHSRVAWPCSSSARSWPQRASRSLLRKPAVLLKRSAVSCAVVATIVSKPKPTNDLTVLENIEPEVFSEHEILGKYFYAGTDLAIQWETLSQDLSKISSLLAERLSEKDFKKYLTGLIPDDKNKIKHIISVFKMLIDESGIDQHAVRSRTQAPHSVPFRHSCRTCIGTPVWSKAAEAFGGVDRLWRLLGNLSNLQLRAHRWYFNAPHLFDDQALEPARLQKTLVRAFKYLHCPQGIESRAQAELVKELEEADDIIDALCTIDPVRTIPPYENQQNRRPPFDQTLYLSPDLLDRQFGHTWKSWAVALQKKSPSSKTDLRLFWRRLTGAPA